MVLFCYTSAVDMGSPASLPLVARAATGCSFAPRQRNQSAQGFALDPRGWRPRPTAIWRAAQGVGFFHRRAPRSTRPSFRLSAVHRSPCCGSRKSRLPKNLCRRQENECEDFCTCPSLQHASFSGQPPDGLTRNFIWIRLRAGLTPGRAATAL